MSGKKARAKRREDKAAQARVQEWEDALQRAREKLAAGELDDEDEDEDDDEGEGEDEDREAAQGQE